MRVHKFFARMLAMMGALLLSLTAVFASASAAPAATSPAGTYIVVSDPSSNTVNANVLNAHGHHVVKDLSQAGVFVVSSQNPSTLASLPGVTGVAKDARVGLVPDEGVSIQQSNELAAANLAQSKSQGCASTKASCPLQWDLARIHVPEAWKTTQGSSKVKVAVLDTGVTSGHEEVGSNYDIAESKSFVQPSDSCPADATTYNSVEDFQGHGTWTALHIAGKNGTLMTGIAPKTTLVNVRVLGACGSGTDSWILNGMLYANQVGASVISMSLGGYSCGLGVIPGSHYCGDATSVGTDPIIYKAYQQVVNYLLAHGTVVVAAAGNDHVQINTQGMVTSHGTLASVSQSNDSSNDYYGLTEMPGGIPGVITVSAVNRVTAAGTAGETKFGQVGVGFGDQLTYYSSYGETVEVSAPGGARNYNVPRFDCAATSTNCGRLDPSTATSTDNPGDFGAWGVDDAGNPCSNCYANIQGTSMATPQVAGVAALLLASHPHLPAATLSGLLRQSVTPFSAPNATPGIEPDPQSPTYLFDLDYNGPGLANALLMGSGVIDAARAVKC